MTNPEVLRRKVNLLTVVYKEGALLMAYHYTRAAFENGDSNHTTAGGGVEAGETDAEAARRELCQEYGEVLGKRALLVYLRLPPEVHPSKNGAGPLQENVWFMAVAPSSLMQIESEDGIIGYEWRNVDQFEQIADLFSEAKRSMLRKAIAAVKNNPEMFALTRSRRAA